MRRRAGCAFAYLRTLVLVCSACSPAAAQTVRPVIVEYRTAAHGKFELVNNSYKPLSVSIQPCSFSINEDGVGLFRPLESNIHVKLSEMSFRLAPQQTRWVFYDATADKLPAWFAIYSSLSGQPNAQGIVVQVDLPHTVYLFQKQRLEKNDVAIESAKYDSSAHLVTVDLSNVSERLGRAQEWQVIAKGKKLSQDGFPLLPQGHRRLEAHWNNSAPPAKVLVRFEHFTLKQDISGSPQ